MATSMIDAPYLASLESKYKLPNGLLAAVMRQESGGNPSAVSPKGALGAFQFMPATAKQYNIDPLDPVQSADGAARMYADLSNKYSGDVPSMLAAYNWGQGNVDRKGLQNASTETREYIQNISANLSQPPESDLPAGFVMDGADSQIPEGFEIDASEPKAITTEKPGAFVDTAKTIGSNLLGGALDVAMTVPNLLNQAVAGPQMLGRALADGVSEEVTGMKAEPRGELWQPFFGSGDVEGALGTAYSPQTTAGKVAEIPSRIIGGLAGAKGIDKTNTALTNYGNKAPTLGADDIKALSSQAYKAADANGGILKPHVTDKFIDSVDNLRPQTSVGQALSGNDALSEVSKALQPFRGKTLTLQSAQEIDEILGQKIDNFVDRATGQISKEGKKLLDAQTAFRKTIDDASSSDLVGGVKQGFDSWKQGKQLWSAQAKARDIEKIIERASYMENPVTGLKTGFRTLATNKARMNGFTAEEQKAIKHAAKTGVVTGGLKIMGSRLISSVTGLGAGAVGGGPVGAVLGTAAGAAAGTPFREAANALQMRRANNVLSKISNRPAVQSAAGFVPKTQTNVNVLGSYAPLASPVSAGYLASFDQREKRKK